MIMLRFLQLLIFTQTCYSVASFQQLFSLCFTKALGFSFFAGVRKIGFKDMPLGLACFVFYFPFSFLRSGDESAQKALVAYVYMVCLLMSKKTPTNLRMVF